MIKTDIIKINIRSMKEKGLIPIDYDYDKNPVKTFLNFPKIAERVAYFQSLSVGRGDIFGKEPKEQQEIKKYARCNKGITITHNNNKPILTESRCV